MLIRYVEDSYKKKIINHSPPSLEDAMSFGSRSRRLCEDSGTAVISKKEIPN